MKVLSRLYPSPVFMEQLDSQQIKLILSDYVSFCDSHLSYPTFRFCSSYIDLVKLLLRFIRATRTSDWHGHLSSLEELCPWLFAYDRTHYSRYAPAYLQEMRHLKETHPFSHEGLSAGGFTVQRQERYGFSALAGDQTLECTMNRDTKVSGGLIGRTLNPNAVQRWILSRPDCAEITHMAEVLAGYEIAGKPRKDLGKSRQKSALMDDCDDEDSDDEDDA